MNRIWGSVAGLCGALAVAAGAFGAHALKKTVGPEAMAAFETGARYHMYHALAIIAVAVLMHRGSSLWARSAAWAFVTGIVLFSGSLYAMALSDMRWKVLGAVTPFGGVLMICGWVLLAVAAGARTGDRRGA